MTKKKLKKNGEKLKKKLKFCGFNLFSSSASSVSTDCFIVKEAVFLPHCCSRSLTQKAPLSGQSQRRRRELRAMWLTTTVRVTVFSPPALIRLLGLLSDSPGPARRC